VLELATVGSGQSTADALTFTTQVAQAADRLGYRRIWVAEHHNMPAVASTNPPVLIAHLAAVTERISVGSGGVMLPNHAPLVVAEQFGMLEALHPGRVDLGIGRAPGTDPLTASALRRTRDLSAEDFPQELLQLLAFFDGSFPDEHPYHRITAVPALGYRPAVWLLGSSDFSAQLAGMLGLPFSFAHHFAAANTDAAVASYRATFRPSDALERPYVMLGVAAIVAETEQRARWLAGPSWLAFLRLRQGHPGVYPTPEEAAEYRFTPSEREVMKAWTASHLVGDPEQVRDGLAQLQARTGADELMVTTMVHGYADRVRSYALLADAMGLEPREARDTAGASAVPDA
jgi:luciferase family oxidoreductase group 1